MYAERPFFQVGEWLQTVIQGEFKAEKWITRLRETAYCQYELENSPNVWFAWELLVTRKSGTEK